MTFKEYLRVVATGADRFAGSILFGEPNVTISALCAAVRSASRSPSHQEKIASLPKIGRFQFWLLLKLGNELEAHFPGHLAKARANAIKSSRAVLDAFDQFIL